MKNTGLRLIRILVVVQIFYGLAVSSREDSSIRSRQEPYGPYQEQTCEQKHGKESTRYNETSLKNCLKKENRNYSVCQDNKAEYQDTISKIQEGCTSTGLKFTACVNAARSCNGSQSNDVQTIPGMGGAALNKCGTKADAEHSREQQEKQQEDLANTQKDIQEKYTQAQQRYQDAIASEYTVLLDLTERDKNQKDLVEGTNYSAEKLEREMRRKLVSSLQGYHQGQMAIAKSNRNLVILEAKLADLPKNYMDSCVEVAKGNQKKAVDILAQMATEIKAVLKEVSTGTGSGTMATYSLEQNALKKKYGDARKRLEDENKDSYAKCIKEHQKSFAENVEVLKGQINENKDEIATLKDQVSAARQTMQEDLAASQLEKKHIIANAKTALASGNTAISVVQMQHNSEINAAMKNVNDVQVEVTKFESKAKSQGLVSMMSGVMGALVGANGAGLGDVVPYIDDYDLYLAQQEADGCAGTSLGPSSRRDLAGGIGGR